MSDIRLLWNAKRGRADWTLGADGDLATGSDIETAVLLSLFTDRRAQADYVPTDGTGDPRGWWGDSYEDSPIGSRLWQLQRGKKSDPKALLVEARDICVEALQWLVADGAASTIDVATNWLGADALGIAVKVTQPDETVLTFNYSWAWNGVS